MQPHRQLIGQDVDNTVDQLRPLGHGAAATAWQTTLGSLRLVNAGSVPKSVSAVHAIGLRRAIEQYLIGRPGQSEVDDAYGVGTQFEGCSRGRTFDRFVDE
jgi:hypothetical protein